MRRDQINREQIQAILELLKAEGIAPDHAEQLQHARERGEATQVGAAKREGRGPPDIRAKRIGRGPSDDTGRGPPDDAGNGNGGGQ